MARVEHLAGSAWWVYSGKLPGARQAWRQGDQRDVPQATADYLTSTFPDGFALVSASAPAAPSAPEVNRAMKPPPKRKAATKKPAARKPAKAKK